MERALAIVAILVAVWLLLVLGLVIGGRRALAREIAALVPNLTRLFAGLLRDPRVPLRAKFVLGATALYLAMPIDLVPDFIPIVGSLDDAIVAAFALRYVIGATSPEIVAEHWPGDPATLRRILWLARA
ncbi:MAG TPA: DUF1232 domain-containing protein [Candidatus Limnocylindria bacterium]|nr:DUF1232 domain-containing protein [Candidatus Limnocylindria bacterium]